MGRYAPFCYRGLMVRGSTIPQSVIEEVKARTSFLEIAGETVQLKRMGRSLVGLCPFHSEKTPSFHVHDEDGFFHCFGCGKKGSVFNFVMETRGLTFPEAVRFLARRAGVPVPEQSTDEEQEQGVNREQLKLVLRAALTAFRQELDRTPRALEYLRARGLKKDILERYSVGFAPPGWDYLYGRVAAELARAGVAWATQQEELTALLVEGGLLKYRSGSTEQPAGEQGGDPAPKASRDERRAFDVFRDRVIFPILRSDGAPIAFGGRILTADPRAPKYLNSAESPLYSKRRTLFGVPQALPALRRKREAMLVEGYMDVLALAQAGFDAVLASCGTAFTEDHARTLSRMADRVTVLFDGDPAGRKAASRTFEAFANSGIEAEIVVLPPEDDPDSLVQREGRGGLERLREGAIPAADYFLRYELGEGGGSSPSPTQIGKAAERFAEVVSTLRNPVERESTLRRGADLLGTSVASLEGLVAEQLRKRGAARSFAAGTPPARSGSPRRESGRDGSNRTSRPAEGGDPRPAPPRDEAPPLYDTGPPPRGVRPTARFSTPSRSGDQAPPRDARAPGAEHVPLNRLHRQIVVTCIACPPVARQLLGFGSLFASSPPPAASVNRLRQFLESIEGADLPVPDPANPAGPWRRAWRDQLARFGLSAEPLIDEAVRQLRAGMDGAAEIGEYVRALEHQQHREALDALRGVEAAESDEGKISAAQQKLLARREYERKRSGKEEQ